MGAYQFEWNLFGLLLLYWAENGIVGLYTVAKMLKAAKRGELGKSRSYQIIFFITHYSTFWVLHGVMLTSILQIAGSEAQGVGLLFFGILLSFAVQHGVSHRVNWVGHSEFERLSSTQTMLLPYARVGGTLSLSIIGGFAVWQLGESAVALSGLAAAKLAVDAATHVSIHRALAPRSASASE